MPGNVSGHYGMRKRMILPKKQLGQHFLCDENIARKIVGNINPDISTILEIGPGMGILSKYLISNELLNPYFIEIDRESVSYLSDKFPSVKTNLFQEDFLTFDLRRIPVDPDNGMSIVGNFPYNISSQILFKVVEHRNLVREVVGMFQKEVAERIASPPGSRKYGILSVVLQAYYTIEYLFTVNETVFIPPPKVKSGVIRLKRNHIRSLECDEGLWKQVIKTGFNQRRKTLRNSLSALTRFSTSPVTDRISVLLSLRPEQLSVNEFVELTRFIQTRSENS